MVKIGRRVAGSQAGVVFDEIEDRMEHMVNYPIFIDLGLELFSLETFDQFQEMGWDDLLEITTNYWRGGI